MIQEPKKPEQEKKTEKTEAEPSSMSKVVDVLLDASLNAIDLLLKSR